MQRLRGLTVAIVLVRECPYKHPEAVSNLTVHEKIVEREGRSITAPLYSTTVW
jgi:hypothetical protein